MTLKVNPSAPGPAPLCRRTRRLLLVASVACALPAAIGEEVSIVGESASPFTRPRLFVASRNAATGQGDVVALRDAMDGQPSQRLWSAADQLQARGAGLADHRLLLTAAPQGVLLRWDALGTAGRSAIGLQAPAVQALRLAPLGEIRNANLWLSPGRAATAHDPTQPALVFAGSADGLLHGFDAEDGSERIAYLPRGLQARVATAAAVVDGPLFAGDASPVADAPARRFLVGALGAGGRGFFMLDVSDPSQFASAAPAMLVHGDQTLPTDPDIGQIYGAPVLDDADARQSRQITRLNDGRWAVVMGNGYFSPGGRPVLLLQYLDDLNRDPVTGARELRKLSPCAQAAGCPFGGDNGLAPPRLLDVDGNGTADLAYAGDLQGQLWKFDLSGANRATQPGTAWRVAFASQPLFTARAADGTRQLITTAPYAIAHPRGGLMLVVGTGRHLRAQDTASTATQSIYGLHDDSAMSASGGKVLVRDGHPITADAGTTARPATLVARRFSGSSTEDGVIYHYSSRETVSAPGRQAPRGWYLDLPLPGQRVLQHPRAFEGHKVLALAVVPDGSGTWLSGASSAVVVNALTGLPAENSPFLAFSATGAGGDIAMASVPPGPAWSLRLRGRLQLRFADGQRALQTGRTSGQRAGWREMP